MVHGFARWGMVVMMGFAASSPLQGTAWADPAAANPLLTDNALPYEAPPFDRIKDADYRPAIEAAIRQHQAEIDRIAANSAPPDFDNTIVAMERSGAALTRAVAIFQNIVQANTNDTLDAAKAALDPQLQAHADAIYLNPALFARVRAIHDAREHATLDARSKFLLENTYKHFLRAGAALSAADQTTLRDLNQQITKLSTSFEQKLLKATADGAVGVDDRAALAGLGDDEIAASSQAATARHSSAKFLLPLRNTTQQPALAKIADRDLRARILAASEARGDAAGPTDLRDTVVQLAMLRARQAKLLGFANFAAFTLDNQMAKTPQAALKLMDSLVPAATAKARGEAAEMQASMAQKFPGVTLTASDWPYYAEAVRRAKYNLDQTAIRPYFEINRVLNDGVFFAANRLYGLTFKERHDIPLYQPDVRVFEVFDADTHPIALFYADYFARPNKQGGAWCDDFVPPSGLLGRRPVVVNVTSFTKPAPGQPALISSDDVTTMFHEFGHALHTIFSNQHYPSQNGFGVPTDVVEFPSQFNENWAMDPTVFANYARHYQTGAPMPEPLAASLRRAKTFDQGYQFTEYLAAALLDMEWHTLPADAARPVPDAFEQAALKKHAVDLAQVPPRYRTTFFAHIWGGGYAANYYAYLWGEVLDHDAFAWFTEHGGLTRENGQRFRETILAPGFTADPMQLYHAFRGRDPDVNALLKARGLLGSG